MYSVVFGWDGLRTSLKFVQSMVTFNPGISLHVCQDRLSVVKSRV